MRQNVGCWKAVEELANGLAIDLALALLVRVRSNTDITGNTEVGVVDV